MERRKIPSLEDIHFHVAPRLDFGQHRPGIALLLNKGDVVYSRVV